MYYHNSYRVLTPYKGRHANHQITAVATGAYLELYTEYRTPEFD
jgi:hypothetical protein